MAGPFAIEAVGEDVASKYLVGLARRGGDPRPAFRKISEELRGAEPEWFATHGRGTWPPLAAATLAAKARRGQPADPLIATGALRRSLTVKRGRGSIRSATKTQMKFGTKVWYGRFQAARPPVIPTDLRTRRRMVNDVRDYLLGKGPRE